MNVRETNLPGVLLLEPRVFEDSRGWFMETYHGPRLSLAGINVSFVQDNHSFSREGVLRGLHYQIRMPQGKLVRVVRGAVFDVAVDLRRLSPTFGRWHGVKLSAENRLQLYIPEGFAHGFLSLSDRAEVIYKCTDVYQPEHERTLLWNDPEVGIEWPIDGYPILSDKDERGRRLVDAECYDDEQIFIHERATAVVAAPHFLTSNVPGSNLNVR